MEDFLWELKTERFLKGKMTPEELVVFEQEQIDQPELKEYVSLSTQLQKALSEDDWFTHKNTSQHYKTVSAWYQEDDVLDFKEKIKEQATIAFNREKKTYTLQKYWIPIAAALFLLFVTIIYQLTVQPNLQELYVEYATWDDAPSLIVQDENTAIKEQIELLYQKERYEECIRATETFLSTSTTDRTNVMIYKGFSLAQLDKHSEALDVFKTISESNSIDASKGLWYAALIYLKTEDTENLRKTLYVITASETNYRYAEALELLNSLE